MLQVHVQLIQKIVQSLKPSKLYAKLSPNYLSPVMFVYVPTQTMDIVVGVAIPQGVVVGVPKPQGEALKFTWPEKHKNFFFKYFFKK